MDRADIGEMISGWVAAAGRRRSNGDDLVCGACPRMESCGLAPSETCLEKLQYRAEKEKEWGVEWHVGDQIKSWAHDWQRRCRLQAEIAQMRPDDLGEMARDLGLSILEIRQASTGHEGDACLMPKRLAALGLDPAVVHKDDPATFKDLERTCARCRSKGRCAHDLARGDVEAGMRDYCSNASTIEALLTDKET